MKFKSVIRWMLLIGLGATVVVGGTGIHYWNQRHDMLEATLRQHFAQVAPDLKLELGQLQLDGLHRVTLSDIELLDRSTDQPLFRARSVKVNIDTQMLLDHQRIDVRSVQVDGAEALMIRHEDGHWNWQDYEFRRTSSEAKSLPELNVRSLRVQLHLKHSQGIPPARLLLTSPHLQAVPSSAHSLDLLGVVQLAEAGELQLSGSCDLVTGAWSLGGQLDDMTADRRLLDLAQNASPRVRSELQQLDRTLQRVLPGQQTASVDPDSALLIGRNISTAPRFQGQLDVKFDIGQEADQPVPRFRLLVDVREGQVSVPGVPVQLSDVDAVFFASHERVELRVHRSSCDGAQLSGRFLMNTQSEMPPPSGSFRLVDFPLGSRLKPMCPPSVQRLFDHFEPDLRVSGTGRFRLNEGGKWIVDGLEARVREGRLNHHRFRYQLTDIEATLRQRPLDETGGAVIIDVLQASGMAGDRPWVARGGWKDPGPAVESHFVLDIADFPLDDRFRQALETPARRVIESLDLKGMATGRLWFDRPPGRGQKTYLKIDANVSDATLRFSRFPYPIDQLSGHVTFDSRRNLQWRFSELQGRHGTADISGEGQFTGLPKPGVLDLTIRAQRLALDSDLYNAMTDSHQSLWRLMDPSGFCDLTTQIHWTAAPGQRAVVSFPAETPVRIYDTVIRPRPFPYEMEVEEAIISFDPNDPRFSGVQYCDVHSFRARHKDAPIVATGWAKSHPSGHWQVHLDHLTATHLPPDDDLRAALPDSWREILTRLDHRGHISVNDSELDFLGHQDDSQSVTAAWNMNLYLHNCAMNAGLDLRTVSGRVTARGNWNGTHLDNDGTIDLESARVLDMPLTRIQGPYAMDDARLILGSQQVLESGKRTSVDRSQRVQAKIYGGTVLFDAVVDSRPGRGYVVFAEVEDAQLQAFAREKMSSAQKLQGNVSAWLAVRGEGEAPKDIKGRGQLEISPAALYEVPVVLELLNALTSFNPGNRTAFDYALLTFDVSDERFNFNQVDLVGESLALRGRGYVGFGGDVWLDFYTRPAKSGLQLGNMLRNLVVNGVTQWTKVVVSGTTTNPQARLAPTGQLDDSVRQFLNAFNTTPGSIPRLSVPAIFPFAGNPMTFAPLPFRR